MTSVSSEPPTLRRVICYNCSYSFHIIPTATISPSAPSSFRCPGCHHRHLIPNHTVSLPLPPITVTFAPSRFSNYAAPAPAPSRFDYEYYDSDEDDYDSDNFLSSLTATDSTPSVKSIVGSLRVKIFPPNSTTQPLQSCSICMVDFDVDSINSVIINELPCKHYFHKDCIVQWLQRSNSCPLCRYKVPVGR